MQLMVDTITTQLRSSTRLNTVIGHGVYVHVMLNATAVSLSSPLYFSSLMLVPIFCICTINVCIYDCNSDLF